MSGDKCLQFVSFIQAQRLKVVGFDWFVGEHFHDDGRLYKLDLIRKTNHNDHTGEASAPTVALALKWARDVKKIIYRIEVTTFNKFYAEILKDSAKCVKDRYNLNDWKSVKIKGSSAVSSFSTYEEAESALLDAMLWEIENPRKQ